MNIFRSEGGIVKTEEEKQQMAEKHRFKKNREFKRRLDEDLENEEADIRSFKFHSFERQEERERQQRKAERRKMFDRQDDEGHSFDRGRKPFNKDRRPFDREKKSFSRDRDSFGKDRKPYHRDDRRMGKERSGSKGRSNFNRNRGDK